MKKILALISLTLCIILLTGCGTPFEAKFTESETIAKITVPDEYTCEILEQREGVLFVFHKKDQPKTGNWSMTLSVGETVPAIYTQYVDTMSNGAGLASKKVYDDMVLFTFEGNKPTGNQSGVKLIDDKYMAVLSAQKDVLQSDIISILNSVKIS